MSEERVAEMLNFHLIDRGAFANKASYGAGLYLLNPGADSSTSVDENANYVGHEGYAYGYRS